MDLAVVMALTVLPAIVVAAGVRDLTTMTIPNWMSVTLVVVFPVAAMLCGLSPMAMLVHFGVGVAALAVGVGLFAFRVIGGGDAKLLAAVSLWMGLGGTPAFILWTAVAGGAFSLILILGRPRLAALAAAGPMWFARLMEPKGDLPYGVAIAFGALAAYPVSPLVLAAFR